MLSIFSAVLFSPDDLTNQRPPMIFHSTLFFDQLWSIHTKHCFWLQTVSPHNKHLHSYNHFTASSHLFSTAWCFGNHFPNQLNVKDYCIAPDSDRSLKKLWRNCLACSRILYVGNFHRAADSTTPLLFALIPSILLTDTTAAPLTFSGLRTWDSPLSTFLANIAAWISRDERKRMHIILHMMTGWINKCSLHTFSVASIPTQKPIAICFVVESFLNKFLVYQGALLCERTTLVPTAVVLYISNMFFSFGTCMILPIDFVIRAFTNGTSFCAL